MDTEDSLSVQAGRTLGAPVPALGRDGLRVGAIRLPRISNSTDVEALACEPGVEVHWITEPTELADVDVVVLPGSKATVSDLDWLRARGLADAVTAHAAAGGPVLGVCGGFQMLCRSIDDPVESKAGTVNGLGLLAADIVFAQQKTLRHWESPLTGYEIHHGQVVGGAEADWLGVGIRRGQVYGTHWHGLLDNDELRRAWLAEVAEAAGRTGFVVATDVSVPARRDAQLDAMADALQAHVDIEAMLALLAGAPERPVITHHAR